MKLSIFVFRLRGRILQEDDSKDFPVNLIKALKQRSHFPGQFVAFCHYYSRMVIIDKLHRFAFVSVFVSLYCVLRVSTGTDETKIVYSDSGTYWNQIFGFGFISINAGMELEFSELFRFPYVVFFG